MLPRSIRKQAKLHLSRELSIPADRQRTLPLFWLEKALTLREPGPLVGCSSPCEHGLVPPPEEELPLPVLDQEIYRVLIERFGGNEEVYSLKPCEACALQAKRLARRKRREKELVLQFDSEMIEGRYLLSQSWLKKWA